MAEKINIAILGSGLFVQNEHLPAVLASQNLTLKAIYSRSLKSARAVAKDVPTIDLYSEDSDSGKGLNDLLARDDIHAVIIALPIPIQPTFIKAALKAGKHVLAEKPVAKDLETARELIAWYRANIDTAKVTFGVAEQFRYLPEILLGAQRVKEFGRVLGCRVRFGANVLPGSKYYETEWRKEPSYQGGFLLDGGVHFIAATRVLLGEAAAVEKVSAFTAQLQEHLPPVDSVDAVLRLRNGSTGQFSASFGTTFTGLVYEIACEGGSVTVTRDTLVTKALGGEEKTEKTPGDVGGVKLEVFAWARSLVEGKQQAQQSPEQALADLEILEGMLRSGEAQGQAVEMNYQA